MKNLANNGSFGDIGTSCRGVFHGPSGPWRWASRPRSPVFLEKHGNQMKSWSKLFGRGRKSWRMADADTIHLNGL